MIKLDTEFIDSPIAVDPEEVCSFMFRDPDSSGETENRYCVGLKFLGGEESDPRNWEFDHCNYWDVVDDPKHEKDPRTVIREKLESVLAKHGTSIEGLREQYVRTAFPEGQDEMKSEIQHRTTRDMRFATK